MILDEDVYLEHYGKKGMKWGTRRAQKKLDRKDNKWMRSLRGQPNFWGQRKDVKIWNAAATAMNSGIQQKINDKYPGDLTKNPKRLAAYHKESATAMTKELNKALNLAPGGATSPSGSHTAKITFDPNTLQPYISFHKTNVKHDSLEEIRFELRVSKTGHILEVIIPDEVLELLQSDMKPISYLVHYDETGRQTALEMLSSIGHLPATSAITTTR